MITQAWFGPQLVLPAQASPEQYQLIIETLLPTLIEDVDRAMHQALGRATEIRSISSTLQSQAYATSAGQPTIKLALPRPDPPLQPKPAQPRTESWAKDFAGPPAAGRRAAAVTTTPDDWLADLGAEQPAQTPPRVDQGPPAPGALWQDDFTRGAVVPPANPKPEQTDWADDFE